MTTYNQPTSAPTNKMAAVGATGVVIGSVVSILAVFGVIVPQELSDQAQAAVAGILTIVTFGQALFTFVAGYMARNKVPTAAEVAKGVAEVKKEDAK